MTKRNCFLTFLMFSILNFLNAQTICGEATDAPPGCLMKCETYIGNTSGYSQDSPRIDFDCGIGNNTQWLLVEVENETLRVINDLYECPGVNAMQVQIFDESFNKVSGCSNFRRSNVGASVTATGLIPGEKYLIGIKTSGNASCPFQIRVEGKTSVPFDPTPPIQAGDFLGARGGELFIDPVGGADSYLWESKPAGAVTFVDGQGTTKILYSTSYISDIEICVTPENPCDVGEQKCFSIPNSDCYEDAAMLPGCEILCRNTFIESADFETNSFINFSFTCAGSPPNAAWFSLTAKDSMLTIIPLGGLGDQILIYELFDLNLNSVSNCEIGSNQDAKIIVAPNVTPGEKYLLAVSVVSIDPFEADFIMIVSGHDDSNFQTPEIKFLPASDFNAGIAYVDMPSVRGKNVWSSNGTSEFISGQGTDTIRYANGVWGESICVSVVNEICGELTEVCTFLPGERDTTSFPNVCGSGTYTNEIPPGCLICGDEIIGSTSGYIPSLPGNSGFPCGTIENNQFFSIIADATSNVSGLITPMNCQNDQGVQLVIFDQDFNPVSNCFTGTGDVLNPGNISAAGLTPGAIYWIMIDGFAGDICDFTLTVSGNAGSTAPDLPGPIAETTGASGICVGKTFCFSIAPVANTIGYEWQKPGNALKVSGGGFSDLEICLEFLDDIPGTLKVTPINPCFPEVSSELWIQPENGSEITIPPIFACPGDFPIFRNGDTLTGPGDFQINHPAASGCDTIFNYSVFEQTAPRNPIPTNWLSVTCVDQSQLYGVSNYSGAGDVIWTFTGGDLVSNPSNDMVEIKWNTIGNSELCVQFKTGCGDSDEYCETIQVTPSPTSDFTIESPVCLNEPATVTFTGTASNSANFNWNFGNARVLNGSNSGPYEIAFTSSGGFDISLEIEDNGCLSAKKEQSIVVNDRLAPFSINCSSTIDEVTFEWSPVFDADNYQVNVLSGQAGNLSGTTFVVSGLTPNEAVDIEVIAQGDAGCQNSIATKTCTAQDCPPVTVTIDPQSDICLSPSLSPIPLIAGFLGGSGTGFFEWSGQGVSPGGMFDPNIAGVGTHLIIAKYIEGNCQYTNSIPIKINPTPTADFTLTSPICADQNALVNYTGTASPSADFNWNFNNGNIVTNSGSTNYEINFPVSGTYDLQLQVTENGCVSNLQTQSIRVDAPIGEPVISCQTSADKIIFNWDDVVGATGFDVQITTGQTGTRSGNSFTVSGLSADEDVAVLVTAETNSVCGNTESTLTCKSDFCPPASVLLFENPPSICASENRTFQLNPIDTGMVVFDSVLWSGQAVSVDGKIEYDTLVSGNYSVFADAYKGSCIYSDTFRFEVYEETEISAKILSPLWYPNVLGGVDLTVEKGTPPYDFNWSNGNETEDLSDVNRAELHCVTVTDHNGCEDTDCYVIGQGIYRISPLEVICRGGSKRLSVRPSRGASFSWSPSNGLSCNDCPSPIASPSQSTVYNVTATMPDGRTATTKVIMMVLLPPLCNTLAIQPDSDIQSLISNFEIRNFEEADLPFLENKLIEISEEESIKVMPNPTSGLVQIQSFLEIETVEVFDLSGRLIFATSDNEIDLSAEAKGVYFFRIKTNGKTEIKRVVLI